MEREFNSYYDKTIESLYDLAQLSGSESTPIIHQTGYYLGKLKDINSDLIKDKKVDGAVFDFLINSFKELISCFSFEKEEIKNVTISGNAFNYKLNDWNKILETFPKLLNVLGLFKLEKTIEFRLEENGIRTITYLGRKQKIGVYRKKCYEILRDLFGKKSILTFVLDEYEGQIRLDLFLNISHSEKLQYECFIGEDATRIAFSNIFEQYIISSYEAEKLPEHICLEISEDLKLKKHRRVPKRFTQVLGDHQIIHFSFLFRPVSIIIPCRGQVTQKALIHGSGDTGRGDCSTRKQDVNVQPTLKGEYIDIFDLISS